MKAKAMRTQCIAVQFNAFGIRFVSDCASIYCSEIQNSNQCMMAYCAMAIIEAISPNSIRRKCHFFSILFSFFKGHSFFFRHPIELEFFPIVMYFGRIIAKIGNKVGIKKKWEVKIKMLTKRCMWKWSIDHKLAKIVLHLMGKKWHIFHRISYIHTEKSFFVLCIRAKLQTAANWRAKTHTEREREEEKTIKNIVIFQFVNFYFFRIDDATSKAKRTHEHTWVQHKYFVEHGR